MMKIQRILLIILSSALLAGCFEDEGNYKYRDLNGPVFDFGDDRPHYFGYQGDTLKIEGKFSFAEGIDSLERIKDFDFEWQIDGVTISKEKDLEIETDSLIKKLDLDIIPHNAIWGTYRLIDKTNNAEFIHMLRYYLRPKYNKGSWIILSEDAENTKMTYQGVRRKRNDEGEIEVEYKPINNVFAEFNDGKVIPGKPIMMVDWLAKHISPYLGSTFILTDKVLWEMNNEDFSFYADVKDEFIGGTPDNFKPKYIYHDSNYNGPRLSIVVNEDGRIFTRQMSENFLGGKFLSEPYVVDRKGTDIEFIGSGAISFSWSRYAYDTKNNRILGLSKSNISDVKMAAGEHLLNFQSLGDTIKIVAMATGIANPGFASTWGEEDGLVLYKNTDIGKYYTYSFSSSTNKTSITIKTGRIKREVFNAALNENSIVIIPEATSFDDYSNVMLYTIDRELWYYDRRTKQHTLFYTFDADITAAKLNTTTYKYEQIAVGLSNGKFAILDLKDINNVKLLEDSVLEVGGKIVAISDAGNKGID